MDIRIPIPDPFGLFERATEGGPVQLFDPFMGGKTKATVPVIPPEPTKATVPVIPPEQPMDEVAIYKHHLKQAFEHAPCPGCKKLVTGALVGVEVYEMMEKSGLNVKDIAQSDIDRIKQDIKEKYGD